jgi:hypothetical protein
MTTNINSALSYNRIFHIFPTYATSSFADKGMPAANQRYTKYLTGYLPPGQLRAQDESKTAKPRFLGFERGGCSIEELKKKKKVYTCEGIA